MALMYGHNLAISYLYACLFHSHPWHVGPAVRCHAEPTPVQGCRDGRILFMLTQLCMLQIYTVLNSLTESEEYTSDLLYVIVLPFFCRYLKLYALFAERPQRVEI
jgi:hypothetical protein